MQHRVLIVAASGVAVASTAFLAVRTAPVGVGVEPVSVVRAAERADPPADGIVDPLPRRDAVAVSTDAAVVHGGFELPAVGATLVVHVVEPSTRRDIPGVRVRCRRPGAPIGDGRAPEDVEGPRGTIERDPLTGPDGRATFDLPAGERLRLTVDSTTRHVEPLAVGERREVVVELGAAADSGARVTGVLRGADGIPARGRSIWIVRADSPTPSHLSRDAAPIARAETDAEGRFELPGIPAGEWWIGPAPVPADTIAPHARWFRVTEDTSRLEVELEAHRGHSIRGAVVTTGDRPVVGTRVWARSFYGSGRVWDTAGADGSFELAPIAPGLYEIGVDADPNAGHSGAKPRSCRSGATGVRLELR